MWNPSLAFGMPGGYEWIVILVIALLIFGKRLPELAKGVGHSVVEFKKGLRGVQDEMDDVNLEIEQAADQTEPPMLKDKQHDKVTG